MLQEMSTKVFASTVKQFLYQGNPISHSAREKALIPKTAMEKLDLGWHLHMGTEIILSGEKSLGQ